ncbi:uncharacterized protein LOC105697317 [Orussus abietinus]|uniref:uncharacterized protein LOC105697317 n=1 Tax=Orussus abietinus TaxID=222816 RepID=UPI0006255774|nr:uncharacterized protein LOC105697317 [Orussus abietinus]
MEEFLNIDWTPALDDIVDNVFINEDRLKREGTMYKIMLGEFKDPFAMGDSDSDVTEETLEEMEVNFKKDITEGETPNVSNNKKRSIGKMLNDATMPQESKKDYVPGVVKCDFKFPRYSTLNVDEHALCLRVILRFSGSEKPEVTQTTRQELNTYMKLTPAISKEQDEFLEFAKRNWDSSQLKILCENYINLRWKRNIEHLKELPRYYSETGSIAFISDKHIEINFHSTCLEKGNSPRLKLPEPNKPYFLLSKQVMMQAYGSNIKKTRMNMPSNVLVSQDHNCENLAETHQVDLVISMSGLKCLANNVDQKSSTSWILPVLIREQCGKKIVYIDKPLPPNSKMIPQKNACIYKHLVKAQFCQIDNLTSTNSPDKCIEDENIFGDIHSSDLLKLEKEEIEFQNIMCTKKTDSDFKSEQQDYNVTAFSNLSVHPNSHNVNKNVNKITENTIKAESNDEMESNNMVQKPFKKSYSLNAGTINFDTLNVKHNLCYKLFTLGFTQDKNELMKTCGKDYKILIRSSVDGIERLPDGNEQPVIIAPKLEHQVALGAEAITLEEAIKQWASLIFQPEASLIRVRLAAATSEVLHIERRSAVSVNNEIKRLYNIQVESVLALLYNIIDELQSLTTGRYLIRHTIQNGSFAIIYKETDNLGKNGLDLNAVYADKTFYTIPITPWPALDKAVVTPAHKFFNRMPAMFHPSKTLSKLDQAKRLRLGIGARK